MKNVEGDPKPGGDDQERARQQQGDYVDQRLRDLAAFECRACGHQNPR